MGKNPLEKFLRDLRYQTSVACQHLIIRARVCDNDPRGHRGNTSEGYCDYCFRFISKSKYEKPITPDRNF